MLDKKIQYLLDHRSEYMAKAVFNADYALTIYGAADFEPVIYMDMLFSTLSVSFLGRVQRLELYKRLINILRTMGINTRLPEPQAAAVHYTKVFFGSGAKSLPPTSIIGLPSSNLKVVDDVSISYSPSSEVMYFAYPDTISSVNTIKDPNGFDITAGWTMRVESLIVDGQPVPYKVYESNNLTELTNYSVIFNL